MAVCLILATALTVGNTVHQLTISINDGWNQASVERGNNRLLSGAGIIT